MLICRNFHEDFITWFVTALFFWLFGYILATVTTSSPAFDFYDSSEDEREKRTDRKFKLKQKKK